jgi:hypothetical protein
MPGIVICATGIRTGAALKGGNSAQNENPCPRIFNSCYLYLHEGRIFMDTTIRSTTAMYAQTPLHESSHAAAGVRVQPAAAPASGGDEEYPDPNPKPSYWGKTVDYEEKRILGELTRKHYEDDKGDTVDINYDFRTGKPKDETDTQAPRSQSILCGPKVTKYTYDAEGNRTEVKPAPTLNSFMPKSGC